MNAFKDVEKIAKKDRIKERGERAKQVVMDRLAEIEQAELALRRMKRGYKKLLKSEITDESLRQYENGIL